MNFTHLFLCSFILTSSIYADLIGSFSKVLIESKGEKRKFSCCQNIYSHDKECVPLGYEKSWYSLEELTKLRKREKAKLPTSWIAEIGGFTHNFYHYWMSFYSEASREITLRPRRMQQRRVGLLSPEIVNDYIDHTQFDDEGIEEACLHYKNIFANISVKNVNWTQNIFSYDR